MTRSLGRLVPVALALWLAACAGRLGYGVIADHPPINLELPKPTVVAASAGERPAWLNGHGGDDQTVAFLGQATARAREDAKKRAVADLFDAVARYVSADVQSSFEATETYSERDGQVKETFKARSAVRAQLGATVERLDGASIYWEQVATPGQGNSFRYFVHAAIPSDEITRGARLSQLKAGTLVVVATFASSPAEVGHALRVELANRLSGKAGYRICPWSLVEPALPKRVEDYGDAIREALDPAVLIELWVRPRDGQIVVRHVVRDPSGKTGTLSGELERPAGELFELQDALVEAVAANLTAKLSELANAGKGGTP